MQNYSLLEIGIKVTIAENFTTITNDSPFSLEVWEAPVRPKRKNTLLRVLTPYSCIIFDGLKLELSKLFYKLKKGMGK